MILQYQVHYRSGVLARSLEHLCSCFEFSQPHLAPDLFQYQAFITRSSCQFQPYAWLQYDAQFRLKMASNPGACWSSTDPDLIATWLSADATKRTSTCFSSMEALTICQLTAHCELPPRTLPPAALSASSPATWPVIAINWHPTSRARQAPEQWTTSTATSTTKEVLVFLAQGVPTIMPALITMEATPAIVPALRHANPTLIAYHAPHTPLRPRILARFLNSHSDANFMSELINSLTNGFNIGYQGPHTHLTAPILTSACIHPTVIDEALMKEVAENRMAGPYDPPPYCNLRCSGVGVVPKKDVGWSLINHLSAPTDNSINDFIDPGDFSLQYATIDDAIKICHILGQGALMAKVNLKNAFRLCPVRQEDWHLLSIHWHDKYFVDKCLPFGLRPTPYLFNMVADALEWILWH